MTLKELMQLCFNEGRGAFADDEGFARWWDNYGQEWHDAYGEVLIAGVGDTPTALDEERTADER